MKYIFFIFSLLLILVSCSDSGVLFKKIDSAHSGILFNNAIAENDSVNPIDLEFLYNGGGVATGDFNNDGLADLYFTGSTVSNKLYINKDNLSFEDVTEKSGVTGEGRWCSSATVVDINNDGLQDIYVCTTIKNNPEKRRNLLYINQGVLQGDDFPHFKESASEYGLDDSSYSVIAAFADFDNDRDLDMFLVTTKLAKRDAATFTNPRDTNRTDIDKLFINEWNDSLKHPVFKDLSKKAGINANGFGLGLAVADINKDGWKDIYVTNDFFGSDNLYINNKDGTFSDKIRHYLRHTSENAMGVDIADINNDGLADILSVDMNPEDNYRKKKNLSGNNYYVYQNMIFQNIMLQYVRNTLQLNMGPRVDNNDSIGDPVFSDISFFTGTAETDWSWSPTIADINNDGNRDILITNGYPRDVTDHDFSAFRTMASKLISKKDLIDQIPVIMVPNYAFSNDGHLQFENKTAEWGLLQPSFSNGSLAVDLDNDGDLDYVVNNINEEAFVYENTLNSKEKTNKNFLKIAFKGDSKNVNGLGTFVEIYYASTIQVYENEPCRGYLSCAEPKAHFGLDTISQIDSMLIRWSGNKKQVLHNVKVNQLLTVDISNATEADNWNTPFIDNKALFADVTTASGIHYIHEEVDHIDFDKERLLPHKFSQYGPGLAAGDVDGNGLDDIYAGGSVDKVGSFLLQQPNGQFIQKPLPEPVSGKENRPENMGVLLFDADNDGDNDLWCANGSNEFSANSNAYADRFYINDGKGNFSLDTTALPLNYTSKSCLRAADIDKDGDLDLFIGGRSLPGKYPMPVSSFIYRNDSKNGVIKFTDITATVCKDLQNIGMVCDAIWTDFDNDGWKDLIITGEWMAPQFFENNQGKLKNITSLTGLENYKGWWNSITAGDFDNDGDIDYI
ncbi:MAG: VCBS repeat-containing protein, partial [Panacibacter sp.]